MPEAKMPWMGEALSDEEVVRRVLSGETELFELLVRRHNPRLFRAARSILRDGHDAEEALQISYLRAWRSLSSFDGRARFATWMTAIVLRTGAEVARSRSSRQSRAHAPLDAGACAHGVQAAPEQDLEGQELVRGLGESIESLPEGYRTVFVLRAVQGLSTREVAEDLGLSPAAVKVRLLRARGRLQADLLRRAESLGILDRVWAFDGERCDRITRGVLSAIRASAVALGPPPSPSGP